MGKLTAAAVKVALKKVGKHSDGGGLFLLVRGPGAASWIARLQSEGRRREYGLGSAELVTLSQAREKCRSYTRELREHRDPLALTRSSPGMTRTFRDASYAFLAQKFTPVNRFRAQRRLEMHALPQLGRFQIQTIDADLIAQTLAPIWMKQPETGRMVRSLIIRTLRYARSDGALLESTLAKAIADRLPRQPSRGNRAAIDYHDVPSLMAQLAGKKGMGALALRLAILCVSRSQEVRGASWSEVDFERKLWLIPAERMKMKRPQKVPLSEEALAVLREAAAIRRANCELVFPSARNGWLSDMTMPKVLRDLGEKVTQHGMRSTFTDWAAEQTTFPKEIRDAAKAHAVSNPVEAAYLRTTFFDKRRDLLDAWGRFANGKGGADVVPLREFVSAT